MADVPLMSNPMTTSGDIIYGGASGAPTRLGKGTDGQVLKLASGVPSWAAESGAGGGDLLPLIGDPPSFAGSADKDFRGAGALTPYTAVGSDGAGTVALFQSTTSTAIYQLTDAGLLIQSGHGEAQGFRADYTLPDTQSIILAITGGPQLQAGDNMSVALRLNDNDTSSTDGNYIAVMMEQDTTEYVVQGNSSIDAAGFEYTLRPVHLPPMVLFRIARAGLVYRSYVSLNHGATWNYVDTDTFGSALTNVWIVFSGASASQTTMPTVRVPFIVEGHGDDAYDPW